MKQIISNNNSMNNVTAQDIFRRLADEKKDIKVYFVEVQEREGISSNDDSEAKDYYFVNPNGESTTFEDDFAFFYNFADAYNFAKNVVAPKLNPDKYEYYETVVMEGNVTYYDDLNLDERDLDDCNDICMADVLDLSMDAECATEYGDYNFPYIFVDYKDYKKLDGCVLVLWRWYRRVGDSCILAGLQRYFGNKTEADVNLDAENTTSTQISILMTEEEFKDSKAAGTLEEDLTEALRNWKWHNVGVVRAMVKSFTYNAIHGGSLTFGDFLTNF